MKKININKILILSALLISLLMIPILNNINIINKNEEIPTGNLQTQDLSLDNIYSGIGDPWIVSHWANRTDYNIPVEFENGTTYTVNMDLGTSWEGYQLDGTIKNLYDKRNWVNGTFECGTDDGYDSDDSNIVQNWTFGYYDVFGTYDNDFYGNYFDGVGDTNIDHTCLGLTLWGGSTYHNDDGYDRYDRCWWETNITMPRGELIEGEIGISIYPYTTIHPSPGSTGLYDTHFSVQIILNDTIIDDKNLIWLNDTGNGDWVNLDELRNSLP